MQASKQIYRQSLIVGLITLFLTSVGVLEPFERALLSLRFTLDERPASGELVVVQIDARSIQELGIWPFNRAHHGLAIDNLREAGAASIAFDVELARSQDEDDNAALVAALKRAGGQVILPSFIQLASAGQGSGKTIRTEPAAVFRDYTWLANVNVYPASDGRIWTMTYGGFADNAFQYSLAAVLAGRAKRDEGAFYVDYSIDLNTIPRLSYIDLLNNNFDQSLIEGKRIIVGGTAVELGDQLNVPVLGVISGPILQALSFETIFQNREIWRTTLSLSLALALIVLALLSWIRFRISLRFYIASILALTATTQIVAFAIQQMAAISLDTGSVLLVSGLMGIAVTISELDARREQAMAERTEKENHARMLDHVIQDSFEGIFVLNEDLRVEDINTSARTILGVEEHRDVVGIHIASLIPDWTFNGTQISAANPMERPGELTEITFKNALGEDRTVEFVVTESDVHSIDSTSHRSIYAATFRDITERRQTEEERDNALQEAVAASLAKTQFLANMSHELRTPLNAIIGFSEIMEQQAFGPLGSEQYVGYAGDIRGSGQHLLSIVNDILDVSRIETGEFSLVDEELGVGDMLDSVWRLAEGWPLAQNKRVTIEVQDNIPELVADHRLAKQMVLNLLSNAVKFSPEGSTITLRAFVNSDGGISIAVQDEGVGIPEESLPKLTEAFFQVDSRLEREYEGSGLGLTLVNKHITLHEGTLSFESEVGMGTTATLSFPRARSRTPAENAQSA